MEEKAISEEKAAKALEIERKMSQFRPTEAFVKALFEEFDDIKSKKL